MRKKVTGFTLCAMLFALCPFAQAQQAKKVPRIGFLVPGSFATYSPRIDAFRTGLRELGHVELAGKRLELLKEVVPKVTRGFPFECGNSPGGSRF